MDDRSFLTESKLDVSRSILLNYYGHYKNILNQESKFVRIRVILGTKPFSLKKMSRFQKNIGLCNSIPDNFLNYWEFNISSKDINLIIKTINKKAIHQICLIRHALGEMFCVGIEGVSDYTV